MIPHTQPQPDSSPYATLRRFARNTQQAQRCEMCANELREQHQHLVEPVERRLVCVCDACALLFCYEGATRYRRVPRDTYLLKDFALGDEQWESLNVPIGLVFFFRSTAADDIVAIYPSPAGPTESSVDLHVWQRLAEAHPPISDMLPDTQALLINQVHQRAEHYLAPIDKCYQLIGLIRTNWSGLTGGEQLPGAIRDFFADMKHNARTKPSTAQSAKP